MKEIFDIEWIRKTIEYSKEINEKKERNQIILIQTYIYWRIARSSNKNDLSFYM